MLRVRGHRPSMGLIFEMRFRPGAVAQMRRWSMACSLQATEAFHQAIPAHGCGGRRCSGGWTVSRPRLNDEPARARAWQNGVWSHPACFAIHREGRAGWPEYRS